MHLIEADLRPLVAWIKKNSPKTVLIQLPEGLKGRAKEIAEKVEAGTSARTITLLDQCFGACDLADEKAKQLKVDALVHFGHTENIKPKIRTFFFPLRQRIGFLKGMEKEVARKLKRKGIKSVALAATVQYLQYLKELKGSLEKKGVRVFIGKGNRWAKEKGQVLGCNYSAVKAVEKKAEGIVLLSDGFFHARGLALVSGKPVFFMDAGKGEVMEMSRERERVLRQRIAVIAKAMEAKSFGVIVSTKRGQQKLGKALEIKKELEEHGKKALVFAMDLVKEENLLGVKVNALVNTACPRIALDDFLSFSKPVIGIKEVEFVTGKKPLKDYSVGEML